MPKGQERGGPTSFGAAWSRLGHNDRTALPQMPAKCRQGHVRRHIQGKFISLLYNRCAPVLKNLCWIMKDIYQALEKFLRWK